MENGDWAEKSDNSWSINPKRVDGVLIGNEIVTPAGRFRFVDLPWTPAPWPAPRT